MARTSEIFTPTNLPTVTDVDRSDVTESLTELLYTRGVVAYVHGPSKLGKTTLVKSAFSSLGDEFWSTYIPGQALQDGADDLWRRLAYALGIPASRETGLASSNQADWKISARLALGLPGTAKFTGGSDLGGKKTYEKSSGEKYDVDTQAAVTTALELLIGQKIRVAIAIDDFQFIGSVEKRKQIAKAMRTMTDIGCMFVLNTTQGGRLDPAFKEVGFGGRRISLEIKPWSPTELRQIAIQGLPALSATCDESVIDRLVAESFGSPQIMQQLCLDLCVAVNRLRTGEPNQPIIELNAPGDWDEFFRRWSDEEAFDWVTRLSAGPNPRKKRRKRTHPGPPERELDGYQLIMITLHELGSPQSVTLSEIKQHIIERLGLTTGQLNNLALSQKVRNLDELASKDAQNALSTHAALAEPAANEDEDESVADDAEFSEILGGEPVPQTVFEADGDGEQMRIRLLDPLLSYALRWHPEYIENARP